MLFIVYMALFQILFQGGIIPLQDPIMAMAGIQVDKATEIATKIEATTANQRNMICLNLHPNLFEPQECSRIHKKLVVRREFI